MKLKTLLLLCTTLFGCISCEIKIATNSDYKVTISHESGFYSTGFDLFIDANSNLKIYYTMDGTEPTINSPIYQKKIEIKNPTQNKNLISNITNITSLENVYFPDFCVDKCQIIKFKGIDQYGDIVYEDQRIFFVGLDERSYSNLPIISLNMSYDSLFDYEKGIYVLGKTYDEGIKEGYPETYPANYNQKGKEWERECEFSYFDENHTYKFAQNIGVRIHGGWSRAFNQKSFNLYARKEYGNKTFLEPFFGNTLNKTVMLRNGGYRDNVVTKTRDTLLHDISENEKFETQRSKPVIVFLNGEYWGIYNLQERFSDSYIEEHYGINKDNVVIVEKDEIDEGNEDDISLLNETIDFFKNSNLSSDYSYSVAKSMVDVDSFISYMSTELISGNIDWPYNNVRLWRVREADNSNNSYEDGKWRFMMYDTDDSAGIIEKCAFDTNPFLNSSHWKNGPLDPECTLGLFLTKFLENNEFKTLFKSEFNRIAEENFGEKLFTYLNNRVELLKDPMIMFYKRFVNSKPSSTYFSDGIDKIKNFYRDRISVVIQYLENI